MADPRATLSMPRVTTNGGSRSWVMSSPLTSPHTPPIRTPDVTATSDACSIPSCERSEEHTSELQSPCNLVCRLLLEKKNTMAIQPVLRVFFLLQNQFIRGLTYGAVKE